MTRSALPAHRSPCCILLYRLVWTAAGVAVAAGQQAPLTLDDCQRLALAAPSALSLARQDREIAARGITQARAGFLPYSQVSSAFDYNSPVAGAPSFIAANGVHEYVAQLAITQEFDTSGRLRSNLARARAQENAAAVSVVIAQRDLKRAVANAYYRALLTRRLALVLEDVLSESERFETRIRLLLANGEAAQADVTKAGLQTSVWTTALRNAKSEAELANQELAAFWTRDVAVRLDLDDVFERPVPEPPPVESVPYMRRPEFSLLDAQKKTFDAQSRLARAALFPTANFVIAYGIDAATNPSASRGFATYLNLNIPVFDWFRARSGAQQFQLRVEQVNSSRSIAERNLSRQYENARTRLQNHYEQIATLDLQVKLAQQNLELSRVRYEGGEGLALEVVTAQADWAQARTNYFTNLANFWTARLDLEVASGR